MKKLAFFCAAILFATASYGNSYVVDAVELFEKTRALCLDNKLMKLISMDGDVMTFEQFPGFTCVVRKQVDGTIQYIISE